MNRLVLCLALAVSLLPASARPQVEASISIGLPVFVPLVTVQPGLQVVENSNEEVFFVGGWYWCRRGDHWYRAPNPHASFTYAEPRYVPSRLAYLPPPGHYRHWRRDRLPAERGWWKAHDGERRRAWAEHDYARRHGRPEGGPGHADRGPAFHGGPAPRPTVHHGGPGADHGPAVYHGAPASGRGGPAPGPTIGHGGPRADHGPAVSRGAPAMAHGGPASRPAISHSNHAPPGHRD